MTLKVRILPFLTTFVQLSARLKTFLGGWLLVLGIKERLVECATVCVKSVVILMRKPFLLKFGLSEKHTKFEKIFLMVLTNQLIYLVNVKTMRKIFSNYVCFSKSPNFTYFCKLHCIQINIHQTEL